LWTTISASFAFFGFIPVVIQLLAKAGLVLPASSLIVQGAIALGAGLFLVDVGLTLAKAIKMAFNNPFSLKINIASMIVSGALLLFSGGILSALQRLSEIGFSTIAFSIGTSRLGMTGMTLGAGLLSTVAMNAFYFTGAALSDSFYNIYKTYLKPLFVKKSDKEIVEETVEEIAELIINNLDPKATDQEVEYFKCCDDFFQKVSSINFESNEPEHKSTREKYLQILPQFSMSVKNVCNVIKPEERTKLEIEELMKLKQFIV
jgi:hypothetical protein